MAGKIQNADIKSLGELTALGATKVQLPNTDKIYTPKSDEVLETTLRKNNDAAITDPDENTDSTQNYEVGSRWINTDTGKIFFCVDNTAGAAVWKQSGSGGSGKLNFITIGTQEDAALSDYDTGQGTEFKESISALGGVLSLTDDTESFRGDVSLKYTANATASNSDGDWVSRTTLIPRGYQRESLLDFAFEFSNQFAEGNAKILMVDSNGKELVNENLPNHVPTNGEAQNFTRRIVLDDGVTSVDWGFFVVNGESSKTIKLDDVVLTPEIGFTEQVVLDQEVDSMIRVDGGAGSSGSQTLTFATLSESLGEAVSYNAGTGEFTAQKAGIYHASVTDESNAVDAELAIRVNGVSRQQAQTYNSFRRQAVSWSGYLNVGDVITFFNSNTRGAAGARTATVSKIGSLSNIPTTINQKIKIPTSELRAQGVQGTLTGNGTENRTIWYNSPQYILGDAIAVDNSNGSVFTIQKDGILHISCDIFLSGSQATVSLLLNPLDPTSPQDTELLAQSQAGNDVGASQIQNLSWTGRVKKGDKIRAYTSLNPANSAGNKITLHHREEDVSVNVNTITPQFEDTDSSVRVYGSAGHGSTNTVIPVFQSVAQNLGDAITYQPDAVNGDSFLINESGIYHVSFTSDGDNGGNRDLGITVNSNQLTTPIGGVDPASRLAYTVQSLGGSTGPGTCAWSGYLQAGDIIRPHTDGQTPAVASYNHFTIAKQANPSVTGIDGRPIDAYIENPDIKLIAFGNSSQGITGGVTEIPFTTFEDNTGSWDGSGFTAPEDGPYEYSGAVRHAAAALMNLSLYKNDTQELIVSENDTQSKPFGGTIYLNKGDRIHFRLSSNTSLQDVPTSHKLNINKIGSLKRQIPVSDQTIDIPTSEVTLLGSSSRGTGSESLTVQFDSLSKISGDGLQVDNSNGSVFTVQKDGILFVTASVLSNGGTIGISKNDPNPSSTPDNISNGEAIATQGDTAENFNNPSWSGPVKAGDKIRIYSNVNPSASTRNYVSISFIDNRTEIKLSNVEPQFEDLDFSLRLNTGNGFGSTNTNIRRFAKIVQKVGDKVKYTDSATDGASFEILEDGIYHISFTEQANANTLFGITRNGDPTQNLSSQTADQQLAGQNHDAGTASNYGNIAWSGYLKKGDIIRPHGNGVTADANSPRLEFSISKVGKPSFAAVDISKFMDLKTTEQQELFGLDISMLTMLDTSNDLRFDLSLNEFKSVGNQLITPIDDGLKTVFRALKKCRVNFHATAASDTSTTNSALILKRNGVQVMGSNSTATSTERDCHVSASFILEKGEELSLRMFQQLAAGTVVNLRMTAIAESEGIISDTEDLFNSDTADWTFSSTPLNGSEKIGTYNIYDYNASSNTAVIRGSAQQAKSQINRNGFLISGRPYNQGVQANAARIDIQIGKGHKAVDIKGYANADKDTALTLEKFISGSAVVYGTEYHYNEVTGILIISAGVASSTSETNRFLGTDLVSSSAPVDGYVTIQASRKLPMAVINKQRTKYQTKILPSNVTTTGDVSSLQFNNLTIGKTYKLTGAVFHNVVAGDSHLRFRSGPSNTGDIYGRSYAYIDGGSQHLSQQGVSVLFEATSETLYAYATATASRQITGSGSKDATFLTLEELPNHEETNEWN